ncbi:MAG TPA: hypothetical protein VHU84_10210 [Lacipirellulaceae bacterium]|nr:hypothetical protein [Lacipirellulaceae bacterium]
MARRNSERNVDKEIATAGDVGAPPSVSHGSKFASWLLSGAWLINAGLLLAGYTVVFAYPRSSELIEEVRAAIAAGHWQAEFTADPMPLLCAMAFALTTLAVSTLLIAFGGIFVGPARFRSTRMWLLLTALVAGWLGLVMIWPEVYWRGQQHRAERELLSAAKLVASLNAHWPSEDDELPNLGPFMAYPKGDVRVLMPLAGAHFPGTDVWFSTVERTGNDVMRFELAGGESDAWLEWRRDGSVPGDFVGGLETQYTLSKFVRLAPHWFLVRYHAGRKG